MKLSTKSLSLLLIFGSIFLILFSSSCYKSYKATAIGHINRVEADGCVFVRLRTGQNKIDKLKELGYLNAADLEIKEIEEENKGILKAFKENWDFSKAYFFMSDESVKIKEGQFNEVNFIGSNLQADPSIKCDCKDGLVVDMSRITTNTLGTNTNATSVEGLVVRDRDFKRLNSPFPYLSKKYFVVFQRSMSTMVKDLNNDFRRYYKIANQS